MSNAIVTAAFQGEAGAFSDEALHAWLGEVRTVGFATFDDVIACLERQETTYGLLPCENTIAGAITRTYDLLYDHRTIKIVGETTHRIEQCLIGVPGATIDAIATVHSHPVALEQCRTFFKDHPHLIPVPAADTAGSVRMVVQMGDRTAGAIGPALAAHQYNGVVLRHGIQDYKDNYTRFFLVSGTVPAKDSTGRVCLALNLPHAPGALYRALRNFAREGYNLRSLVARPLRGAPFEYTFYLEIENAVTGNREKFADCVVLGDY